MRKRRKHFYYFFILILLILYLFLEIFLPGVVEKRVKSEIKNYSEDVSNLEVSVNAFPAWNLIFSRADRIDINADYINLDGLLLRDISAQYEDIIIENGEIKGNNTDLRINISEKNLNQYINNHYNDLGDFEINLNPGQVFMKGDISILNTSISLQLNGKFMLVSPNEIKFNPTNIKIENLTISEDLIREYIKDFGFSFNLSDLNFPINVEKIKVENDELKLLGGIFVRKAES